MPQTNYDILARSFFDLAKKVEEIAASDVAIAVETFDNDDYASVVANLLDAAYWILAGQLEDSVEDSPIGRDLYVSSSVYNDLLYRGYDPAWAWVESGMIDMFGAAPGSDELLVEESQPIAASGGPRPGDYVAVADGDGVRAGMLVGPVRMFCFDGGYDSIAEKQAQVIDPETVVDLLEKHAEAIQADQRRRVEQQPAK